MARVLVTDGDERSALAVVRSLGRAGHFVVVGAGRLESLSGASRFAAERVVVPDALSEPREFAAAVGEAARKHHCDLVLPVTDASALALLAAPEAVSPATLALPPQEVFLRISDKARVATVARSLGIRVPRQQYVERREELTDLGRNAGLIPPLVLKPARSVALGSDRGTKHSVAHARDWETAAALTARLPDGAFPLLVQERIVGPGLGVFLLVWQRRLLAAFAHKRLREKPPSGGVSVLCESVELEPDLLARSEALLAQHDWSGVAMIEYKRDSATGEPVLMEINGRFWGSLQLAIDAGVDFPALLVDAALGRPVTPVTRWRVGVRGRWFWGDADHLLARLRRSAAFLSLPADAPGRLATVGGFARSMVPPWHDQVFRLTDLGPALREVADRIRAARE